jgi:hypothetical protein
MPDTEARDWGSCQPSAFSRQRSAISRQLGRRERHALAASVLKADGGSLTTAESSWLTATPMVGERSAIG